MRRLGSLGGKWERWRETEEEREGKGRAVRKYETTVGL
jgi:predicted transcriptional regulator